MTGDHFLIRGVIIQIRASRHFLEYELVDVDTLLCVILYKKISQSLEALGRALADHVYNLMSGSKQDQTFAVHTGVHVNIHFAVMPEAIGSLPVLTKAVFRDEVRAIASLAVLCGAEENDVDPRFLGDMRHNINAHLLTFIQPGALDTVLIGNGTFAL